MRKIIIPVIFAAAVLTAVIAACSGYLNNQDTTDIKGAGFLALSDGSGFISSDNYNEITPFLYRDGGKAWLFFASDRPGSGGYDIYYAVMDTNGQFSNPVLMDININTISNETSPVVYKWAMGLATNTYISFIRTLGTATNIITYMLNSSMQATSWQQTIGGTSAMHIGYLYTGNIFNSLLLMSDGTTILKKYFNSGTGNVNWGLTSSVSAASTLQSANGFQIPGGLIQLYITGIGSLQLAGFAADQSNHIKNLGMSDYSSGFKDVHPFIDAGGGYKIYFASDRFGKGNYDLYRYNNKTYDNVAGNVGKSLDAPVLDPGNVASWNSPPTIYTPNLNWSTVFGADGYEVYRFEGFFIPSGPMAYTNYVLIASTGITNYFDTVGSTWSNQLWYMIIATNSTQRSGFSNPIGNLHYY